MTKEENLYTKMYFQGRKDAELSKIFWHTEEPTEEGEYLLLVDSDYKYVLATWDGKGFDIDSEYNDEPIIAWHKIPPYEENI